MLATQVKFKSDTAFLVIDVQNDFLAGGALAVADGNEEMADVDDDRADVDDDGDVDEDDARLPTMIVQRRPAQTQIRTQHRQRKSTWKNDEDDEWKKGRSEPVLNNVSEHHPLNGSCSWPRRIPSAKPS